MHNSLIMAVLEDEGINVNSGTLAKWEMALVTTQEQYLVTSFLFEIGQKTPCRPAGGTGEQLPQGQQQESGHSECSVQPAKEKETQMQMEHRQ